MKIHLIAAARPNFMKIAPLYHALKKERGMDPVIVHTGQHYDLNMSDVFFRDLMLPAPDIHLGVGSGTHGEQTGQVMMAYEKILEQHRPDWVVVVGDVNSTMACTLAAVKVSYGTGENLTPRRQGAKKRSDGSGWRPHNRPVVAHLEAGLRSFDRTMPEEINRLVTDSIADILWTPSPDGDENLCREGVDPEKIIRVGNIMIDSLEMLRGKIEKETVCKDFGLKAGEYGLATLHRPANVDDPGKLKSLCSSLMDISEKLPLVFPLHPRTRKNMEKYGLYDSIKNAAGITLTEPINYIRFMNLVFNCRLAITDSGGIQEETTYLGIPCITLRPNTERPVTVTHGTNRLCRLEELENQVDGILSDGKRKSPRIDLWDGKTADRVVRSIKTLV